MNKDSETLFSITAIIDLLGFSNHLILSSYDLRTKIGEEAVQRLRIIEDAIELIALELEKCPDFYPETFRYLRFNDSLILGIDINPPIVPSVGKPNIGESFKYNDIRKFFGEDSIQPETFEKTTKHFNMEAFKACQFLGIVSRVHNYLNSKEYDLHMPGCRTIVSSGLRYRFISNQNKEDYYSANFSLSNAYTVNKAGSKKGFIGNKCYIENNVASICGLNAYSKRAIGFAKYIMTNMPNDPFSGETYAFKTQLNYLEAKLLDIELFNKDYQFRELNTIVASNLQMFPSIIERINKEINKDDTLLMNIKNSLTNDTPNITSINSTQEHPHFKYPLLFFSIRLEDNIQNSIDFLLNKHYA